MEGIRKNVGSFRIACKTLTKTLTKSNILIIHQKINNLKSVVKWYFMAVFLGLSVGIQVSLA